MVKVSDPSFSLATVGQPRTRLGDTVDTEDAAQYSQDADGDDLNSVAGQGDDEDGIKPPSPVSVLPGDTYTVPDVSCTDPGQVAGWIDWNANGLFDPGERSVPVECNGTTRVALTWRVPPSAVASTGSAHTFLRLRIGTSAAAVASPVGAQIGGETEDYPLDVVIVVPTAADDVATTAFATPVTIDVLSNDSPPDGTRFDPRTVRLIEPDTGNPATSVTDAAGTYRVDTDTGRVTFAPAVGFRGPTPPVAYQVTDNLGRTAQANVSVTDTNGATATSSITPTVTPVTPVAMPDPASTGANVAVTIDVLANDRAGASSSPLDRSTVRLIDPPTGRPETTLTVADQGTFSVDQTSGVATACRFAIPWPT